jgi:UDP-glucose 4-epimerase
MGAAVIFKPCQGTVYMNSRALSCVVLGGGGFLGTNLCRGLAYSGARVRAFGHRRLFPDDLDGVEWRQGDFSDAASVESAIESFDIVFHLIHSHVPQFANQDMPGDVQQNIIPSLALLEISRKLQIRRIVYVSSGGTVYGSTTEVPTPETAPTDPITAYGINKLAIEKYLALYEHLYGLSFRVLRVANPFGAFQLPAKNQGIIAALISRALQGQEIEIWGDGSVVRDYIFVDDVIDALQRAVFDESNLRVFNIGSGQGRSLRQVIATIEAQLGAKVKIQRRKGRAIDVPISTLAIERAANVLGWVPTTPFEVGLTRTIEWWRERKI